jgi:putative phage-type endonuclease
MEQRSDEWHQARVGKVTASHVGAILGLSPHMTRAAVLRRMVRDALGAEPEFTGNIATEYGQANEEGAIAEYYLETGNKVQPVGFMVHPDEDWAGCSPDGLINDDGGLEAKCPFGKRKEGELAPLAEQPHYYAQVQFSLWVTGRKFWHFYQWTPRQTMLECVLPDQAWRDENLPRLRQFYAEYLDAMKDPADHLAPRRVEIDTLEAARIVAEYDQLSEAIENATARKAELLAEMVRQAGGKDAIYAGRKLTKIERAGAVSYAKALAHYAPGADLEPFRGKPSSFWGLK